jgi:hypothetical protein
VTTLNTTAVVSVLLFLGRTWVAWQSADAQFRGPRRFGDASAASEWGVWLARTEAKRDGCLIGGARRIATPPGGLRSVAGARLSLQRSDVPNPPGLAAWANHRASGVRRWRIVFHRGRRGGVGCDGGPSPSQAGLSNASARWGERWIPLMFRATDDGCGATCGDAQSRPWSELV